MCAALLLALLLTAALAAPAALISVTITRNQVKGIGKLYYKLNTTESDRKNNATKVTVLKPGDFSDYNEQGSIVIQANGSSSVTVRAEPTGEGSWVNLRLRA